MKRREFISLLGGAAALPLSARAQPSERVRRVGIFMDLAEQDAEGQTRVAAFRNGLQDLGWTEGRNVKFDTRWTAGDPALMRRYAPELVGLAPEVIMNGGLPTLAVMQQETRTIPIVFAQVLDPVGAGFVESLARPGGNITGFVSFEYTMAGKWLETLKLMAPHIVRIAAIRDLASPSEMGMLGAIKLSYRRLQCPSLPLEAAMPRTLSAALNSSRVSRMAGSSFCRVPTPWFTGGRLWLWRRATACLLFTPMDSSPAKVGCYRTELFPPITFDAPQPTSIASLKAQIRENYRSRSRLNSNLC